MRLTGRILAVLAVTAAIVFVGCPNGSGGSETLSLNVTGVHEFPAHHSEGVEGPLPLTVTVRNTGTDPTGELTAEIGGANADAFMLFRRTGGANSVTYFGTPNLTIPEIAAGGTAMFSVFPRVGGANGTFNATVTVSGAEGSGIVPVSFTVRDVTPPDYRVISNTMAHWAMQNLTGFAILDVRTEAERYGDDDGEGDGRFPGSYWLHYDPRDAPETVDVFLAEVEELLPDKNRLILVY